MLKIHDVLIIRYLHSDLIKIGITDNLERRMRELDKTATPLPFECVYAIEVEDSNKVEHLLHDGLGDYRTRKSREFFENSIFFGTLSS